MYHAPQQFREGLAAGHSDLIQEIPATDTLFVSSPSLPIIYKSDTYNLERRMVIVPPAPIGTRILYV